MILFGIILILLAALIGLGGLWATTSGDNTMFQVHGPLGLNVDLPPASLIVIGMLAMGLLWAGWWMMKFGTKRGISRRRERKDLEREKREHERALAETNAKLGATQQNAAEAERRREEERVREATLRVEADRRRGEGREEELRRLAAERDAGTDAARGAEGSAQAHAARDIDGSGPPSPRR